MNPVDDEAAVRKLFEQAAACGNRYKCPPADELEHRAAKEGETVVLKVAFDLMCDPNVRSFDRLGDEAYQVVAKWGGERRKRGAFDAAAQQVVLEGVKRVLKGASPTFRGPTYGLITGLLLPGGEQILRDEMLDPARSSEDLDRLHRDLASYQKDLSLFHDWLGRTDDRTLLNALAMLEYVDHSRIDQQKDELPLLTTLARRPKLSSDVAGLLIEHIRGHEDHRFLPPLDVLAKHSDPEVRKAAVEAIGFVKDQEAKRAAQPK